MEHYRLNLHPGQRPSFDEIAPAHRRRAFGVDYGVIKGLQGGELLFTRAGWAIAPSLLPRHWFDDERFRRLGRALPKATGSVYRVPIPHPARRDAAIVVKFCRFAQDIGGTRLEPGLLPRAVEPMLEGAEFSGPFEEFGHLTRIRGHRFPAETPLRTVRPLGIYCPPTHHHPWQLGRDASRAWRYDYALAAEQPPNSPERRLRHHWERVYVLLYPWINGIDLEDAARRGLVSDAEARTVTREAAEILLTAGYAVLDHKARHVIVRPDPATGRLLRQHGRLVYSLIDYELLVPLRA